MSQPSRKQTWPGPLGTRIKPPQPKKCTLPQQIERLLAALSQYFGRQGRRDIQSILVNCRHRVTEATSYDNSLEGPQTGHTLHLVVPGDLYYPVLDNVGRVERDIESRLNRLAKCPGEYIDSVVLEMAEDVALGDWREQSGLLLKRPTLATVASGEDLEGLWKPHYMRVFLSHKAQYKKETAGLKECLLNYGVSCFVAHKDIKPTRKWQEAIEKALSSMDVLVALTTPDFHESDWTDQEIGVAIGLGVPVIPVRLGMDPYGFIGKYQAVPGRDKTQKELAKDLFELFFGLPELRLRATEGLVVRFEDADSFAQTNSLMGYIEQIKEASPALIQRLEKAMEDNSQVRHAFEAKERLPRVLKRLKRARGDTVDVM